MNKTVVGLIVTVNPESENLLYRRFLGHYISLTTLPSTQAWRGQESAIFRPFWKIGFDVMRQVHVPNIHSVALSHSTYTTFTYLFCVPALCMPAYMKVKCHRCGHEWTYTGLAIREGYTPRSAHLVGCSQCGTTTKVVKNDKYMK
jgi:hypothetical protein